MKILVAGAGGYLGIPLVARLLGDGHEVVALDRFFFGRERFLAEWAKATIDAAEGRMAGDPPGRADALLRSRFVQDDVRTFDQSLLDGVEAVVDLAGLSNDACGDLSPDLTTSINRHGAAKLLRQSMEMGVRRYVYASSASVYGHGVREALKEDDICVPQTEYARAKFDHEQYVSFRAGGVKTFEPVILRNATLYGVAPRMRWDLVVNVMTMRAWKDGVIYVMGGGEQWRPLLHVDDAVDAVVAALIEPAAHVAHRVFNVGETNMRVRDIAARVKSAIPEAVVHDIPDGPDKRDYHLSFDAFHRATGWRPRWDVSAAPADIVAALRTGRVRADDPTAYTVHWYKSIIEWETRLRDLAIGGKVLA